MPFLMIFYLYFFFVREACQQEVISIENLFGEIFIAILKRKTGSFYLFIFLLKENKGLNNKETRKIFLFKHNIHKLCLRNFIESKQEVKK